MTDLADPARNMTDILGGAPKSFSTNDSESYRTAAGHGTIADKLGPIKDFPGFWEGVGYSIIARPNFSDGASNGFFLELNLLRETIEFTTIGSPVFNRGSLQDDIAIYGVTYLHRVTDGVTGGALHIEPGMWLNIPATTDPETGPSIARLATIPHGNALSTVGFAEYVDLSQPVVVPPANTVPFAIGQQVPPPGTKNPFSEYELGAPNKFRSDPLPPGFTQDILDDPNTAIRNALTGQNITKIIRLITSTETGGELKTSPSSFGTRTRPTLTPSSRSRRWMARTVPFFNYSILRPRY